MGNNNNKDFEEKSNRQKADFYKEEMENRQKKLTDEDLEKMENSPFFDADEMFTAYNYRTAPFKDYKHYDNVDKKFNEKKNEFNEINLDEYRKEDSKFDLYKLERPLKGKDSQIGNGLNFLNSKIHHEGLYWKWRKIYSG